MYNLRLDLIAGIQSARDVPGLAAASLEVLGTIGTDLDRLWSAINDLKGVDQTQERRLAALETEVRRLSVALNKIADDLGRHAGSRHPST